MSKGLYILIVFPYFSQLKALNAQDLHNEKMLLSQVAAGSEEAFRTLFDAYSSRLLQFALQLTGNRELAEDLVQDSFLTLWVRREQLTEIEHFSAYLYRMVRYAVLRGLKRKAIEADAVENKIKPLPPEPEQDDLLHIKFVKEVLNRAVQELPEQQRKVWLLRREEGRRTKEVAELLGISEITVKRHLGAAQQKLRDTLQQEFPLEGGILIIILGLIS